MKNLFVLFILLTAFSLTNAQQMYLGLGGKIALPMGTFGDVTSTGFGGGGKFEYKFKNQINLTGSIDYLSFSAKEDFIGATWSVIPVMVGAKYYIDKSFYGGVEFGLNFNSVTVKIPAGFWGAASEVTTSESKFGFGFGAGYEIPMNKAAIDLSVKYSNFATDANAIVIGVAYKFGI